MSVIDGFWTSSTDDIFRGTDRTKSLSEYMDEYDTCIKTVNTQFEITNSNGTLSGTCPVDLKAGSVYLVSINYVNGNALADRTLYVLRGSDSILQPTMLLVDGNNGNDSLVVMKRNGSITFASTYTGTATKATVRIV